MHAAALSWKVFCCAAISIAVLMAGCHIDVLSRQLPGDAEHLGHDGVILQTAANDCGVAALRMILDRFGIPVDYGELSRRLQVNASGTTLLRMKELAAAEGLLCQGWRLAARDLPEIPLPAVLLLRRNHFVVLEALNDAGTCLILDPAHGRLRMSTRRLLSIWHGESLLFSGQGGTTDRNCRWFQQCQQAAQMMR